MMPISSLHHVSLVVADTRRALGFYRDLLGIPQCERPPLAFPGAWLELGPVQVHLLELPNPDPTLDRPEHVGRDRHTAFVVDGLESLKERLQKAGIPITASRSGRAAIFCRDPDGNGVELIEAG